MQHNVKYVRQKLSTNSIFWVFFWRKFGRTEASTDPGALLDVPGDPQSTGGGKGTYFMLLLHQAVSLWTSHRQVWFGLVQQWNVSLGSSVALNWSSPRSAQCFGQARCHRPGSLSAICVPHEPMWRDAVCEVGRQWWPRFERKNKKSLCVSDLSPGKVWPAWGGRCWEMGQQLPFVSVFPSNHPSPTQTCTPAHTHTQFHCDFPRIELKNKEQRQEADSAQGMGQHSPLRSQPVCPCWPHLIQSHHNQRSSVSSPNSLTPARKRNSFFFSPWVGTEAGSKDISVSSEQERISVPKCFWNRHTSWNAHQTLWHFF